MAVKNSPPDQGRNVIGESGDDPHYLLDLNAAVSAVEARLSSLSYRQTYPPVQRRDHLPA